MVASLFRTYVSELNVLCLGFWMVCIVLYYLLINIGPMKHLVTFGKQLLQQIDQDANTIPRGVTNQFLFTSSYCLSGLFLLLLLFQEMPLACHTWTLLFFIHISRRIWECFFVHKFSVKYVHFYKLPLAYLFYFMVIVSTNVALYTQQNPPPRLQLALSVFIFAIGNFSQNYSHKILSRLRSDKSKNDYSIPQGFLFRWVSCPHYLSEMTIYFSFTLLCTNSIIPILILIFVCSGLTATALDSHAWYKRVFSNYPPTRKAVLPLLI